MSIVLATDNALLWADHTDNKWTVNWHDKDVHLDCLTADPSRAWAGTTDGRVLRSKNRGESWGETGSMADRVTSLTISPHNPEVVWAGTEPSRLYKSEDGGETWSEQSGLADLQSSSRWSFPPRPNTHHVRWIAEDLHKPGRLFLAIEAGAFVRSQDGGETWLDHPDGARRDTHTIATHPNSPGTLYVAAGDGYAESYDGGSTWVYPQTGLEHRYVWSVAVSPGDPDEVFISAASGASAAHDPNGESYVYRRSGSDWDQAMNGLPGPQGMGRAVLTSGPDRIYAATNHGIFARQGEMWKPLSIPWPPARRQELPRGLAVVT